MWKTIAPETKMTVIYDIHQKKKKTRNINTFQYKTALNIKQKRLTTYLFINPDQEMIVSLIHH